MARRHGWRGDVCVAEASARPLPPQLMEPSAAQLSAAVLALINTLIARQGHPGALLRLAQGFSFARWGLEGYVIAESNKLTGGGPGRLVWVNRLLMQWPQDQQN